MLKASAGRSRLCYGWTAAASSVAVAALLVGCAGADTAVEANGDLASASSATTSATTPATEATALRAAPTALPTTAPVEQRSIVAHVVGRDIDVYEQPARPAEPAYRFANPTPNGGPLVFLVDEQRADGWLRVLLPVRPNGTTGWVRADQVELRENTYRIEIELAAHQITVYDDDEVILSEPIGTGTDNTPTPGGRYYVKELLQPPNPDGAYGPFAYGLSGFSPALTDFGGGDGTIGIHGTNDPALLGTDVSHGCIRMSNEGITYLAGLLPLGTPVAIHE